MGLSHGKQIKLVTEEYNLILHGQLGAGLLYLGLC